ncbi:MAG: glycerophosphodiester phosphodiesterase [Pseudomonadota bacterium]
MHPSNFPQATILAHRGTSIMAPENTLPAFEFARACQADTLEMDVRLTRDRVLLVTHDETVDRTTNGSGSVAGQSASELQKLDAGYRFLRDGDHPFRGGDVRLLTIAEVLSRFPAQGINVDIKDNSIDAVDVLAREILQVGAEQRVVVASFHHQVLSYCRARYPQLATSACSADVKKFLWQILTRTHVTGNIPVSLFQLPCRYWILSFKSRWFIDAVHDAGGQIHFWTINNRQRMQQLLDAGADGIVTDRPDIAARLLGRDVP